jgi:8-oxo-dGTP pyrophosphatase MutT (NUDIX family)
VIGPTHSWDVLDRITPAVPPALVARVEAWTASQPVAEPRPSASVVLLRDGATGLETYLLHRHARMAFAASMAVFPGGAVEPVDGADDAVRACAIRETEEETTVRLAPDDLRPWAHWTTPTVEPRRYDTWFFVARLPAGQQAADVSGETERAEWIGPARALAEAGAGRIALMPPTLSILTELADATAVEQVLAAADDRVVAPVLPELVRSGAGWTFRYPRARR